MPLSHRMQHTECGGTGCIDSNSNRCNPAASEESYVNTAKLNALVEEYMSKVAIGPGEAGDYAASLDDSDALMLYDFLVRTKSPYLVKPLYYCYKRQAFRFTDGW